jgi:autoinducer 2 (AI-2) kinase
MSSKRYLLVIDVGTGSGRSIIFDDRGAQISASQKEWSHLPDPRYRNSADFDCVGNWKLICECVRGSMERANIEPDEIAAVSATSMRHGIVCYGSSGEEVFAVPNVDARAESETAQLIREGWGPRIYEIQGDWPNIHALARLRWLRKHEPETFDSVRMMTMLSDWVIHRLSGEYSTEASVASSSGMFDIKSIDWSKTLVELAGLRRDFLPAVHSPGMQVGEVTPRAARETGLAARTPVVNGMGDTQSGYVGSGVIAPGQCGVVAGTFWLPSIISSEPMIDSRKRVRTNCHAVKNLWIIESCTFYTGLSIRWFRDALCQEETRRARELGKDPYELMERLAERVPPGSHGVQVIMSNICDNSRWIHASPAFLNFDVSDPGKYDKAAFYRALLENAAYQVLGEMENIVDVSGGWPKEIIFSGGGSKSALLSQILADTLGVPIKVPVVREATALGAAVTSACGVGMYRSLEEAVKTCIRYERVFHPGEEENVRNTYRNAYKTWRAIYPYMLELVEKGLTRPMWKAPGA